MDVSLERDGSLVEPGPAILGRVVQVGLDQDDRRRAVVLGRRNTDFIEVLDGLDVGEKVVTSPYTSYAGMDRLSLSDY